MQTDLYTLVHKAQRHHMGLLAASIGKADFSDPDQVDAARAGLRNIIGHLRDHAANEERYIHPLFRKLGHAAEGLEAGHHELEAGFGDIEHMLAEERWGSLYAAYSRLFGIYLLHMDEEEEAQRSILWPNYADEELAGVFNRFKAERPPAAAMADLEFMLPALSVPELTEMFMGMKRSAPAAAFEGAYALAARTLEAGAWRRVAEGILRD